MTNPRQGTEEWLAWRRGGIGASELPAILGADPWRGEYELALLKRGETEPEPENEAQAWGKRIERLALDVHAETTGRRIRYIRRSHVSRSHPHVFASLDGRVVGAPIGVEVKLTGQRWDELPRRVVIQAQAQMAVIPALEAVEVVKVGLRYAAPEVFLVERDEAAGRDLLDLGEAWYVKYVQGDELPPVDGSRAAGQHLARYRGTEERAASEEQVAYAMTYAALRDDIDKAETMQRQVRNLIKASMAGAGVITGGGYRVTWSEVRGRTLVNWQGVAKAYRTVLEDAFRAGDRTLVGDAIALSLSRDWPDARGTTSALDTIESLHTSVGEPTDRLDVREAER